MKDEKAWTSQVELSLDNRQIFLLFFASAVVLSLVFALGVVVGKRMDSRPARPGATDPLALLDQVGGDDTDENLGYQQALAPESAPSVKTSTAAEKSEPAAAAPEALKPAAAAVAAPAPAKPVVSHPAARTPAAAPSVDRPERATKAQALARVDEKKASSGSKDKSAKAKKAEAAGEGGGDGSYTLQLSSFQEKREAEAFMEKLRQAGMKPYMNATAIPGRGVWYRVRLGHFKSWDDAVSAKQNFEKQQKMIAYVSKL